MSEDRGGGQAGDVPSRFSVDFTGATLLGVYRVEKMLAAGGMGSLYLAEDTNLGRKVVVKVPHPRFLGEPGFRSRFAQEIADLVRLEHPHIVRILARGEHDELSFFVLQYLGGGTLEDRLEAAPDHRQSPAETFAWFRTIATTLDYVAERGIVHRDVKPGNILFDDRGHVFLSDFGVAKTLEADSGITGSGVAIGSPKYMAPEQGLGDEVGPAADQYALASTLFEALAGQPPFTGKTLIEVLLDKSREDPPGIRKLVPELPAAAELAISRALSRKPEDRFSSCTEFADAFLVAMGAAPSPGTPAPKALRSPSAQLRAALPLLSILAPVVIALVLGGVYLFGGGSHHESDPVTLVSPGSEPRRLLRYDVEPGVEQSLEMTTLAETDLTTGDQNVKAGGEPMALGGRITVLSVDGNGVIRYRWEGGGVQSEVPSGDPRVRFAQGLSGLKATVVTNDRGLGEAVELEDAGQLDPMGAQMLEGFVEGIKTLCVPLPAEPVGLGARWEVTSVVSHMGMRLTQTTAYELVEWEGDRLRLQITLAQTAPPQDILAGVTGQDAKVRLKSFHSQGEGEATVELGSLVPVRSEYTSELNLSADDESEDGPNSIRIHAKINAKTVRR